MNEKDKKIEELENEIEKKDRELFEKTEKLIENHRKEFEREETKHGLIVWIGLFVLIPLILNGC